VLLGAECAVSAEVKGNGAPEVAPPPGEHAFPHVALGREEGDDYTQHVIGEAADEVKAHLGALANLARPASACRRPSKRVAAH
jgi:hypothetical protein